MFSILPFELQVYVLDFLNWEKICTFPQSYINCYFKNKKIQIKLALEVKNLVAMCQQNNIELDTVELDFKNYKPTPTENILEWLSKPQNSMKGNRIIISSNGINAILYFNPIMKHFKNKEIHLYPFNKNISLCVLYVVVMERQVNLQVNIYTKKMYLPSDRWIYLENSEEEIHKALCSENLGDLCPFFIKDCHYFGFLMKKIP